VGELTAKGTRIIAVDTVQYFGKQWLQEPELGHSGCTALLAGE